MRRRARHRLIGAAVLVLVGVIGFPLLFDTQPRPIAVDIPIEIPDRNKVKPLAGVRGKPAAPVRRPCPASAPARQLARGAGLGACAQASARASLDARRMPRVPSREAKRRSA